jgi:DNA-binding GntR family transcriptional regulator
MQPPSTATDQVYDAMRGMIIQGEMPPGSRLIHRQLAKRFGTSNTPVIEAIRRLDRDGLVDCFPGWGAQVKSWTREDIETAYLAREALEGIACRLFVGRASPADKYTLNQLVERYRAAIRRGDFRESMAVDLELHLHIVNASRMSSIHRLVENSVIIARAIRIGTSAALPEQAQEDLAVRHDNLVSALLGDDPDAAERAGREHIRDAMQRLLAAIAGEERGEAIARSNGAVSESRHARR